MPLYGATIKKENQNEFRVISDDKLYIHDVIEEETRKGNLVLSKWVGSQVTAIKIKDGNDVIMVK